MINPQPFTKYPPVNVKFTRNLMDTSAIPGLETVQARVIWGSLLGMENRDVEERILLNSPEFVGYIEQTTRDFVENHNNLRKFPRFEDSDWDV